MKSKFKMFIVMFAMFGFVNSMAMEKHEDSPELVTSCTDAVGVRMLSVKNCERGFIGLVQHIIDIYRDSHFLGLNKNQLEYYLKVLNKFQAMMKDMHENRNYDLYYDGDYLRGLDKYMHEDCLHFFVDLAIGEIGSLLNLPGVKVKKDPIGYRAYSSFDPKYKYSLSRQSYYMLKCDYDKKLSPEDVEFYKRYEKHYKTLSGLVSS